nr:carbamoyl-phosphate synthase arginine-specific large chain [Quercus suber]
MFLRSSKLGQDKLPQIDHVSCFPLVTHDGDQFDGKLILPLISSRLWEAELYPNEFDGIVLHRHARSPRSLLLEQAGTLIGMDRTIDSLDHALKNSARAYLSSTSEDHPINQMYRARSLSFTSNSCGSSSAGIEITTSTASLSNHVKLSSPDPCVTGRLAVARDYVAVKVPQFAWTRLAGADPYLGVEMSSTGEMACFGTNLVEAYWTAMQSTMNFRLPEPGEGLLFGGDTQTPDLAKIVDYLNPLGYKFYAANQEVKLHLETVSQDGSIKVEVIEFPKEDKRALREVFEKYDIRGVFNLAKRRASSLVDEDYVMRRNAVDFGVPLFMEPRVSSSSSILLTPSPPLSCCNHSTCPPELYTDHFLHRPDRRPLCPMYVGEAPQAAGYSQRGTSLERLHRW